jgi:hypothetical protein
MQAKSYMKVIYTFEVKQDRPKEVHLKNNVLLLS